MPTKRILDVIYIVSYKQGQFATILLDNPLEMVQCCQPCLKAYFPRVHLSNIQTLNNTKNEAHMSFSARKLEHT